MPLHSFGRSLAPSVALPQKPPPSWRSSSLLQFRWGGWGEPEDVTGSVRFSNSNQELRGRFISWAIIRCGSENSDVFSDNAISITRSEYQARFAVRFGWPRQFDRNPAHAKPL